MLVVQNVGRVSISAVAEVTCVETLPGIRLNSEEKLFSVHRRRLYLPPKCLQNSGSHPVQNDCCRNGLTTHSRSRGEALVRTYEIANASSNRDTVLTHFNTKPGDIKRARVRVFLRKKLRDLHARTAIATFLVKSHGDVKVRSTQECASLKQIGNVSKKKRKKKHVRFSI